MPQKIPVGVGPYRDFAMPRATVPAPVLLDRLDLHRLPYPVALTARRFLAGDSDPLRSLFRLKDCLEASVRYLGAMLLVEFLRSPAATDQARDDLLQQLIRPSLGTWINTVAGSLGAALTAAPPLAGRVAGLFFQLASKGKPTPTALLQRCRDFLAYRNDALGHGAERPDAVYRADLLRLRPTLDALLAAVAGLAEWRLCLVADTDRCQVWMGPEPSAATEPGRFRPDQVGRFVLWGLGETIDLYPFLCYLPSPAPAERLHFYDSVYRYQASRKAATVLEYDEGWRHPRPEPIDGLERAFTAELLAVAMKRQRQRLAVIEGRVASFWEILEQHADIVGRRFAVERVQDFLRRHDRGLLVMTAEPGKGKTALLSHLIEHVFGDYAPAPVHFFYRRTAGITGPDVCERSLYHALLRAHDLSEAEESRRHDEPWQVRNKLRKLLAEEIAPRLRPDRPQLLFIDALDEANGDAFAALPDGLPAGVFVIVTCRPMCERSMLARRADVEWFDLDDPDLLQEHLRDGREYVQQELVGTDLPVETMDEVARLGAGNFLVLTLLCRHLRTRLEPGEVAGFLRRLATDGGADRLGFIYEEFWGRLLARCSLEEADRLAEVAGLLTLAYTPLTAAVVCEVLGLRSGTWEVVSRRLMEYLRAVDLEEGDARETVFRIYHESFADFLRSKVVAADRRRLQKQLADYVLQWEEHEGYGRRYALQFGPRHLLEVGRVPEAVGLLLGWRFLEAKAEAGLVFDLAGDFTRLQESLAPDHPHHRMLGLIGEALRRDIHFLERHPETLLQCLWNSCWWYDCPEAAHHLELSAGIEPPWSPSGGPLSVLLGSWRAAREREPGRVWLRSLRPPEVPLGTAQKSVFRGHEGGVTSVAVSADGRHVVSGSADGTVRVWDAGSGAQLGCWSDHTGPVRGVAFAPHGDRVVSGSEDGTVRVWDAAAGSLLACHRRPEGGVYGVAFSPDGRRVAFGGRRSVRVWDPGSGAERVLGEHLGGGGVAAIAFSPDGRRVASGGRDWTVRVWDAERGGQVACLSGHRHWVEGVVFSPDGRHLVSASWDRTLCLWDLAGGRREARWQGHQHGVLGVAFSPDGSRVASASEDRTVRVWDAATGNQLACLAGHEHYVTAVAFFPDGRRLATGSVDRSVRVWDLGAASRRVTFHGHEGVIRGLAFSADGRLLASGGDDRTVRAWDPASGRQLLCLRGHEGAVQAVTCSPDGKHIASGSWDQTVRVWDARTGAEVARLCGHAAVVEGLSFAPRPSGGRCYLASGSWDGTVRLWDLAAKAEVACLGPHEREVTCVALSDDERHLASGSMDGVLRIWETAGGSLLACHHLGTDGVWGVAFSPDGGQVVFRGGAQEQTVGVCDLASGTCRPLLEGRADVAAVAAGSDRSPWLGVAWNLEFEVVARATGEVAARFPGQLGTPLTHPDGRSWAAASGRHLHLIRLEGDRARAEAAVRSGRNDSPIS
jgi:WD40 repeat protein